MTPVPTIALPSPPGPTSPTTISSRGDTTDTGWVPCFRARQIILKESWSGGPGTDGYNIAVEFSDDGVNPIFGQNALGDGFLASPARTSSGTVGCALTAVGFTWPFVCPFQFVRFTAAATGGVTDLVMSVQPEVNADDLVSIERITVLPHALRNAGTYPTDWFKADDLQAAAVLYLFDEGESYRNVVAPEFTDDETVIHTEDEFGNVQYVGNSQGGPGNMDTYSPNVVASSFNLLQSAGERDRSLLSRIPFAEMRYQITITDAQEFHVDVIAFRARP